MGYKVLIVDDEELSRNYIRNLVHEFQPSFEIYEADNAFKAKELLEGEKFDILFLDISMPECDGFTMLQSLTVRSFELIFITAYNQHAIKAIKERAFDYILKPIKKTEFKETLAKVVQKLKEADVALNTLNQSYDDEKYLDNKMSISHHQGIKLVSLKDIIYLKADNSYTTLVLSNGQKVITSKPIHRFEKSLHARWFFRIHKSYIINALHFVEYLSREGDMALMDNGEKLNISRYRLSDFLDYTQTVVGKLKI